MEEDYSQPFFVGINNERFPHRDDYGYLSALEEYPKEVSEYPERVTEQDAWTTMELTNKQWDTINQLKAQVLFLSSKVNEMRANASKRKRTRY